MPGKPEAVLVRALEPVAGDYIMAKRRAAARRKTVELTNGPSRLCMAMGITKAQNKTDLTAPPLYIEGAPPIPKRNRGNNTSGSGLCRRMEK